MYWHSCNLAWNGRSRSEAIMFLALEAMKAISFHLIPSLYLDCPWACCLLCETDPVVDQQILCFTVPHHFSFPHYLIQSYDSAIYACGLAILCETKYFLNFRESEQKVEHPFLAPQRNGRHTLYQPDCHHSLHPSLPQHSTLASAWPAAYKHSLSHCRLTSRVTS